MSETQCPQCGFFFTGSQFTEHANSGRPRMCNTCASRCQDCGELVCDCITHLWSSDLVASLNGVIAEADESDKLPDTWRNAPGQDHGVVVEVVTGDSIPAGIRALIEMAGGLGMFDDGCGNPNCPSCK